MNDTTELSRLIEEMGARPEIAGDIVALLELRVSHALPDGTTVVALSVEGLDLYVSRSGDGSRLVVSVGTDELPEGVTAVVEANDGMSWEQQLP